MRSCLLTIQAIQQSERSASIEVDVLEKYVLQSGTLATDLLSKYLILPIGSSESHEQKHGTPVLHPDTRSALYQVVLLLATDLRQIELVLEVLNTSMPPSKVPSARCTHKLIMAGEASAAMFAFDHEHVLRSHVGIAGMVNLSNTCYLNSLFTQLYMTPRFREFILNLEVVDPAEAQSLLHSMQQLFAGMQDGFHKAANPTSVTQAIMTYDGPPINVTVQMDVDEFYNLLFDRLESQMFRREDKQKFSSFFSGEVVQQIKSRDCKHISERTEKISAIQCEIQGKQNLLESLRAYTEGEVMEGDNKYSCSSCGKYVNAVKRSCLKRLPNNLIMHLKRFDYDLSSGYRSKVNDYFSFPTELDMAPYTLDHLANPDDPSQPDIFKLVGVLVHNGTAEAGHYYSYIQDRQPHRDSWIEFNDEEVRHFDPSDLGEQAFGGCISSTFESKAIRTWNAYMLFYERKSTIVSTPQLYHSTDPDLPISVGLPAAMASSINEDNLDLMRKLCLHTPEHAVFASELLARYRQLLATRNSLEPRREKETIEWALSMLEGIFFRSKHTPGLEIFIDRLLAISTLTAENARFVVDWTSREATAFKNLIIRPSVDIYRHKMCRLLFQCTAKACEDQDTDTGSFDRNQALKCDLHIAQIRELTAAFAEATKSIYGFFRSWDDFWGLLADTAGLSAVAASTMQANGLLLFAMEVLLLESNTSYGGILTSTTTHALFYRLRGKGRKYSFKQLVRFVAVMLESSADDDFLPNPEPAGHGNQGQKLKISEHEAELLEVLEYGTHRLALLQCAIESDITSGAHASRLVRALLSQKDAMVELRICHTLRFGAHLEPASESAPWLDCTAVALRELSSEQACEHLLGVYGKGANTIGHKGGPQYLAFFNGIRRITNDNVLDDFFFERQALMWLHTFTVSLLVYPQEKVRLGIRRVIDEMLFEPYTGQGSDGVMRDSDISRQELREAGRKLGRQCLDQVKQMLTRRDNRVRVPTYPTTLVDIFRDVSAAAFETFFDDGAEEDRILTMECHGMLPILYRHREDVD